MIFPPWVILIPPCSGLSLARQPMPTEPLYHSSLQQNRVEEKIRWERPHWSRGINLIKQKEWHSSGRKRRQKILFSPLAGNDQTLPRKHGLNHTKLFWKANIVNKKCPLSCSFLFAFIAKQASYGMAYLFGQFWPDLLAKLPPKVLLTASPVVCVRGSAGDMALTGALPSSSQKPGVLSPPLCLQARSPALTGLLWGKLSPFSQS